MPFLTGRPPSSRYWDCKWCICSTWTEETHPGDREIAWMGDSQPLCCKSLGLGWDRVYSWRGQIYNGIALLALSLHPRFSRHRIAGPAIFMGTTIFSGSIWALTLDRERRYVKQISYLAYLYGPAILQPLQISVAGACHAHGRYVNDIGVGRPINLSAQINRSANMLLTDFQVYIAHVLRNVAANRT